MDAPGEAYLRVQAALAGVLSPTERTIRFLTEFGTILEERGGKSPLVVGGAAVEIYTAGHYMSHDIDIKSDYALTLAVLEEMGFCNEGRSLMFSEDFNILVDWQGAALEEGRDAEERALRVIVQEGKPAMRLIALEDLIVDRLEACKFGGDKDSLLWARALYTLALRQNLQMDISLLQRLAQAADVADILEGKVLPQGLLDE